MLELGFNLDIIKKWKWTPLYENRSVFHSEFIWSVAFEFFNFPLENLDVKLTMLNWATRSLELKSRWSIFLLPGNQSIIEPATKDGYHTIVQPGPKMSSDNRGQKRIYIRLQRRLQFSSLSIERELYRYVRLPQMSHFLLSEWDLLTKNITMGKARQIHPTVQFQTIISFCFKWETKLPWPITSS